MYTTKESTQNMAHLSSIGISADDRGTRRPSKSEHHQTSTSHSSLASKINAFISPASYSFGGQQSQSRLNPQCCSFWATPRLALHRFKQLQFAQISWLANGHNLMAAFSSKDPRPRIVCCCRRRLHCHPKLRRSISVVHKDASCDCSASLCAGAVIICYLAPNSSAHRSLAPVTNRLGPTKMSSCRGFWWLWLTDRERDFMHHRVWIWAIDGCENHKGKRVCGRRQRLLMWLDSGCSITQSFRETMMMDPCFGPVSAIYLVRGQHFGGQIVANTSSGISYSRLRGQNAPNSSEKLCKLSGGESRSLKSDRITGGLKVGNNSNCTMQRLANSNEKKTERIERVQDDLEDETINCWQERFLHHRSRKLLINDSNLNEQPKHHKLSQICSKESMIMLRLKLAQIARYKPHVKIKQLVQRASCTTEIGGSFNFINPKQSVKNENKTTAKYLGERRQLVSATSSNSSADVFDLSKQQDKRKIIEIRPRKEHRHSSISTRTRKGVTSQLYCHSPISFRHRQVKLLKSLPIALILWLLVIQIINRFPYEYNAISSSKAILLGQFLVQPISCSSLGGTNKLISGFQHQLTFSLERQIIHPMVANTSTNPPRARLQSHAALRSHYDAGGKNAKVGAAEDAMASMSLLRVWPPVGQGQRRAKREMIQQQASIQRISESQPGGLSNSIAPAENSSANLVEVEQTERANENSFHNNTVNLSRLIEHERQADRKPTDGSHMKPTRVVAYRWPFIGLVSFMIVGATGNTLVCAAVWRERRLQTATNYFLLSLAVADLLVCTLVMPFGIIYEFYGQWPFDWRICNLWVTSDVLTCSSSILHMCFISVGRYLGIRNPLHARQTNLFVSRRAVLWRIALAWISASLIASPLTMMSLYDHRNIIPSATECAISNRYFLIFGSMLAFFIPMFVMVWSYIMTVRLLSHRAKYVRNNSLLLTHNNNNTSQSLLESNNSNKSAMDRRKSSAPIESSSNINHHPHPRPLEPKALQGNDSLYASSIRSNNDNKQQATSLISRKAIRNFPCMKMGPSINRQAQSTKSDRMRHKQLSRSQTAEPWGARPGQLDFSSADRVVLGPKTNSGTTCQAGSEPIPCLQGDSKTITTTSEGATAMDRAATTSGLSADDDDGPLLIIGAQRLSEGDPSQLAGTTDLKGRQINRDTMEQFGWNQELKQRQQQQKNGPPQCMALHHCDGGSKSLNMLLGDQILSATRFIDDEDIYLRLNAQNDDGRGQLSWKSGNFYEANNWPSNPILRPVNLEPPLGFRENPCTHDKLALLCPTSSSVPSPPLDTEQLPTQDTARCKLDPLRRTPLSGSSNSSLATCRSFNGKFEKVSLTGSSREQMRKFSYSTSLLNPKSCTMEASNLNESNQLVGYPMSSNNDIISVEKNEDKSKLDGDGMRSSSGLVGKMDLVINENRLRGNERKKPSFVGKSRATEVAEDQLQNDAKVNELASNGNTKNGDRPHHHHHHHHHHQKRKHHHHKHKHHRHHHHHHHHKHHHDQLHRHQCRCDQQSGGKCELIIDTIKRQPQDRQQQQRQQGQPEVDDQSLQRLLWSGEQKEISVERSLVSNNSTEVDIEAAPMVISNRERSATFGSSIMVAAIAALPTILSSAVVPMRRLTLADCGIKNSITSGNSGSGATTNGQTASVMGSDFGTNEPQMIRYLGSSMQVRSEQKATKVLGVVFFTFVICWSPFFVFNFTQAFVERQELAEWISNEMMTTFLWLGYISSTINPVIYTVFNRNFRNAFRQILLCQPPSNQFSVRSRASEMNRTFRVSQFNRGSQNSGPPFGVQSNKGKRQSKSQAQLSTISSNSWKGSTTAGQKRPNGVAGSGAPLVIDYNPRHQSRGDNSRVRPQVDRTLTEETSDECNSNHKNQPGVGSARQHTLNLSSGSQMAWVLKSALRSSSDLISSLSNNRQVGARTGTKDEDNPKMKLTFKD